jgi:hypothetical protein
MFSRYALQQDVLSVLKQADKGTKDIAPGKSPKQFRANYQTARERLADLGEVIGFGYDYVVGSEREDRTVTFRHNGYTVELTVGGRYNVLSEMGRRGPKRQCHCSNAFRTTASGNVLQDSDVNLKCERLAHLFILKEEDENRIGDILQRYEDGSTGLHVNSGRYGWKSGICEDSVKGFQQGISPRKQTKIWELELRELLAAQRKLIGQLRTAER